ncbi:histidine-type phosphatase [Mycoplasmopsis felifaucium]|uniref:Histidine-type phosphatase n=1 Tax=Mycoplasmopsis felifaucium TaxID=35768 RepID=A0ABZ2RQK7_9BACT
MKKIIFSRHGLRYPFFTKEKSINFFNKDILNWEDENVGNPTLTKKGALIELRFGQWLKDYLQVKEDTSLKVIANSTYRTYETAQLLSLGLKPGQDTYIECKDKTFKTEDDNFQARYINESYIDRHKLCEFDEVSKDIYQKINQIFELDNDCKYNQEKTNFELAPVWYKTSGPLFMSSSFSDVLQLKYYLGFKEADIFKSDNFINDLKMMLKAKDRVLDFIFANKKLLSDGEQNIYKLIKKEAKNDADLTLIVGHDTSIASLLCMLDIEMPEHNQLEKYPIGSKVIFTMHDDETFDLEYTFFDYEDIRNFQIDATPKVISLGKGLKFKY